MAASSAGSVHFCPPWAIVRPPPHLADYGDVEKSCRIPAEFIHMLLTVNACPGSMCAIQRSPRLPFAHPINADTGRPAQAAGECGRVVLDVPDVDDLMFQGGHLVPGEAALRGREIERINAGID